MGAKEIARNGISVQSGIIALTFKITVSPARLIFFLSKQRIFLTYLKTNILFFLEDYQKDLDFFSRKSC